MKNKKNLIVKNIYSLRKQRMLETRAKFFSIIEIMPLILMKLLTNLQNYLENKILRKV